MRLSLAWVVEKFGVVRDGAAVDLVTAMAAWSGGHGGHDGGGLVSMPGGPSLADTLAAAWQPGPG